MQKNLVILFLLASIHLSAQKKQTGTPATRTPAKPATNAPAKLGTMNDTLQYAIGAYLAQWVNNNGFLINRAEVFLKGMEDVFQNRPRLIADSTIGPLITMYQQATQKDRARRQEQQLFASIKEKPGLGIFPNGVHYFILKTGQGPRPSATDSVELHIKGNTADGTLFDDTYQKQRTILTIPADLVPGLADALQMMTEGSKWQLYIPAALAYGDKGSQFIAPNSALVVDVELVKIKPVRK